MIKERFGLILKKFRKLSSKFKDLKSVFSYKGERV